MMEPITQTSYWEPITKGLQSDPLIRLRMRFHVFPSYTENFIRLSEDIFAVRENDDGDSFLAMCSWKDLTHIIDPLTSTITHKFIKSIETEDGTPLLYAPRPKKDFELEDMGPSEPHVHVGISTVKGIDLEYRIQGKGPLVVMLHDLFDTNNGFDDQINELARNYTVAAPNLPGFGLSDKIKGAPTLERTADILAAFTQGITDRKATIVGHGFGGTLAWVMAYRHPELISSIVVINGPHPVDFAKKLGGSFQLFRSWNFFLFQIPYLPKWILKANDGYLLKALIRSWSHRPHTLNVDQMAKEMLKKGVLDSALGYYRGALRSFYPCTTSPYAGKVKPYVKVIWGEKNPHLGTCLAKDASIYTQWIRSKRIPDAGHWIARENSGALSKALKDFID